MENEKILKILRLIKAQGFNSEERRELAKALIREFIPKNAEFVDFGIIYRVSPKNFEIHFYFDPRQADKIWGVAIGRVKVSCTEVTRTWYEGSFEQEKTPFRFLNLSEWKYLFLYRDFFNVALKYLKKRGVENAEPLHGQIWVENEASVSGAFVFDFDKGLCSLKFKKEEALTRLTLA